MSKLQAAIAGQQAARREQTPYERFRAQLNLVRPDIVGLVGKDNVDKFVRVCLNAVQANPAVLEADRRSLLLACLRAAQDNLLPDGREAVLNIYKTKVKRGGREEWIEIVQYLPMVGGLVKKLYDSGHVTFVDAVAVRERDDFEYHRGDEPKIVHKPYIGEEDPGKVVAAYIIAKLKNGEVKREVMSRRDIEIVRSKSKAPNGPMWAEDAFYDQAAIKSVIKRAYKQLPSSLQIESTIEADNAAIGLDVPSAPTGVTGSNVEAIVDGRFEQELADAALRKEATVEQEVAAQAVGAEAAPAQKAEAKEPPKKSGRDKGTPELKQKFITAFGDCKDSDVLSIKADEMRFYEWSRDDLSELNAAYDKRLEALTGE